LKSKEPWNFIKHKWFDVTDLRDHVKTYTDQWQINTSRQKKFYPHKNTETVFIYESDLDWKLNTPYKSELKSDNKTLLRMVEPIIKQLEKIHNGSRGQVLLIKLAAGKGIPDHEDSGDYLINVHRHHIPLVTSPRTKFFVDGEEQVMGIGDCWEINNAKMHAVMNASNIDRIHLLVDIMPNAIINDK
jgi:quercetin dioxygenase-like cupin family protein